MIRVTIELLPGGDEEKARCLGAIGIANDTTGTKELGNYDVVLLRFDGEIWRTGRVEGFPRDGQLVRHGRGGGIRLGAYDLLYRALKATVGERNP